ncbi:polyprenyl synthetase family protein [Ferruginivarius sediminum]|uniref:Polyprenyl synthetase family protein n=1 Tax=Ferruginivarius sediminum TaxID=2661937 RepID=A0A369T8Q0_9PROT|nr:farnesyl diphosphate synthase [Ferruginivarius sediminum]RDD60735.1 polyprenyl synthetase family protein [Ferruginivarius sediminum]
MKGTAAAVTRQLDQLLPKAVGPRGRVVDAMRYATLGGGKRLRPFLVVASARLFNVRDPRALRVAAAVEMVHCYSLVHDDLPAMDDSDLRRGKPTVHKKYDQATAILAGDGLLTEAFAVLADSATHNDSDVRAELVRGLAAAAGASGMVGGQMIDISDDRTDLDLDGVTELQRLKTGALIGFACQAGAVLGRADQAARDALAAYATDLGLAFQIADDILDVESSAQELGKPTGQDEALHKATFVGLLGLDAARKRAEELVESASSHLERFGDEADLLAQTARFVVARKK